MTKPFEGSVYRELKEFVRLWVKSGETLTEEDIERWKKKNLNPVKQPALFSAKEIGDENVSLCPECHGRGCGNCEEGLIVRKRLLTDLPSRQGEP